MHCPSPRPQDGGREILGGQGFSRQEQLHALIEIYLRRDCSTSVARSKGVGDEVPDRHVDLPAPYSRRPGRDRSELREGTDAQPARRFAGRSFRPFRDSLPFRGRSLWPALEIVGSARRHVAAENTRSFAARPPMRTVIRFSRSLSASRKSIFRWPLIVYPTADTARNDRDLLDRDPPWQARRHEGMPHLMVGDSTALFRVQHPTLLLEARDNPLNRLGEVVQSDRDAFRRVAMIAASLTRLAISAPVKPVVNPAIASRSMSGARCTLRTWTLRISRRPLRSGRSTRT